MSASAKALAGLAVAAISLTASAQSDGAVEYLIRSMQRTFPANISAILLQRDPGNEGSFQRVKVERSRDGSTRCTILQPLRYQGFTLVDDGDRLRTYLPDDNIILDQESPAKSADEIEQRMRLARRNYSFRLDSNGPIAGRQVVCVVATPKFSDLDIRKYYLDASTSYPLRLETYGAGNEIVVVYDTKLIEFPKALDKGLFTLQVTGAKTIKYNRPTRVVSSQQAKSTVGFVPLVPTDLPMGFQVQEVQFNAGPGARSIAVRLSDGLARATVYESKADVKMKAVENSSTMEYPANGIRLMIVSDLGKGIREQLLRSFIQQSTTDPAMRTDRTYGLLGFDLGLRSIVELAASFSALAGLECRSSQGCVTTWEPRRPSPAEGIFEPGGAPKAS
jgi:hypothetical protein